MLYTQSMRCAVRLDRSDSEAALRTFAAGSDWTPALRASQRELLRLAGVDGNVNPWAPTSASRLRGSTVGDLFFKDGDTYYVIFSEDVTPTAITVEEWRQAQSEADGLQIGIVSKDGTGIDERLTLFAGDLEQAVRSSLDGRKTRHMTFEWQEIASARSLLERFQPTDETTEIRVEKPALTADEVAASGVLADEGMRRMVITLARSGFTREKELLALGRKDDRVPDTLKLALKGALVESGVLLECQNGGAPIVRLPDEATWRKKEVATLVCGVCGKAYSDHRLTTGYSVSALGRKLTTQSYWMTVWTTRLLEELGIPTEGILWNIAESGEEVDILLEFRGELWIFELKDREFGAGDAYAFNYRVVRYGASHPIVITTDKVSKDARRVFDELAREGGRGSRARPVPVYIEGLMSARDALSKEVSSASLAFARRRLGRLGEAMGFSMAPILAAKYGQDPGS